MYRGGHKFKPDAEADPNSNGLCVQLAFPKCDDAKWHASPRACAVLGAALLVCVYICIQVYIYIYMHVYLYTHL